MIGGSAAGGEKTVRKMGKEVFGPLNAFDLCTEPSLKAFPLHPVIDSNDHVCFVWSVLVFTLAFCTRLEGLPQLEPQIVRTIYQI